ncbi:MAG: hypothetical protein ACI9SK_000801 [Zhongshania sp.]
MPSIFVYNSKSADQIFFNSKKPNHSLVKMPYISVYRLLNVESLFSGGGLVAPYIGSSKSQTSSVQADVSSPTEHHWTRYQLAKKTEINFIHGLENRYLDTHMRSNPNYAELDNCQSDIPAIIPSR